MDLSKEFFNDNKIYLNHAAVSPWSFRTRNAVTAFCNDSVENGAIYYNKWLKTLQNLKMCFKRLLNASSEDYIAVLKNTSEGLSLIASGINWKSGDNVIICDMEFPSNRIVWESLKRENVDIKIAEIKDKNNPEEVMLNLVDEHTKLISVSSVQYADGLRMDLKKMGEFCEKQDILFCVDAIQSLGALEIDVQEVKADFVVADGHKWMMGPEGVAVFYVSPRVIDSLKIMQFGWYMVEDNFNFDNKEWTPAKTARRFECGSPNMLGIHALQASLSFIEEVGIKNIESEILNKAKLLVDRIQANSNLELITNPNSSRLSGIVTFKHKFNNEELFKFLIENQVICALRGGAIRFSPHFYIPNEKILKAMDIVDTFDSF